MEAAMSWYGNQEGVEISEPNYLIPLSATPNDPGFTNQWALHNTGQTGGLPEADYFLGYIYQTGKGVPRDLNRAVSYYRRAAQGGEESAQKELRKMGLGW